MAEGFDLRSAAGKTARVWQQARGGMLLFLAKEGETEDSVAGYRAPLRTALVDDNGGHVNVVVCESDHAALKLGIENLVPSPNVDDHWAD
jgi:hypothetical protein